MRVEGGVTKLSGEVEEGGIFTKQAGRQLRLGPEGASKQGAHGARGASNKREGWGG